MTYDQWQEVTIAIPQGRSQESALLALKSINRWCQSKCEARYQVEILEGEEQQHLRIRFEDEQDTTAFEQAFS
ncbi:hypothetical protein [Modicisalibacter luteus]|uniref:Uncharacterized protein n=1 Tax=Modicisalibacter luteus TaxID=453962 RepID=A0ABV7M3X8_9GAMM|nr:hypothetical protein [Halomonas lutea]GHA88103.1 hypothetical protein GCM10007159_06890 [Halomonas lutea]